MGVSKLLYDFRHLSTSLRIFSLFASVSSSSDAIAFFSNRFCRSKQPNPNLRFYSSSSTHGVKVPEARPTRLCDIVESIRRNDSDFESRLDRQNVSLTVASVVEIFHTLNAQNVPALRFFNWIRDSIPSLSRNHEICSLLIDNIGRLNDYDSITRTLIEFRCENICLMRDAFRFLLESSMIDASSVSRMVNILNSVGGSCGNSGVRSLIEMFSSSGSFEMAKFVIRISEVNASHYNILIRELCRRDDAERARAMLEEMSFHGCNPSISSYNLVLSVLCKRAKSVGDLVREMEGVDCPPDAITYEIVIVQSCRLRRFDFALELINEMARVGLETRISTHSVLVKAYFDAKKYEEGRNYVVDWGSNVGFCLLAELHLKERNVFVALDIILEMIGKGMRPSLRVYSRLLESLRRSGRADVAGDLEAKFCSLSQQLTSKRSA